MPSYQALDMQTREEFIRRIVSRSGIMTSKGRRELERELNAHLEDAIAEARSEGCDEATILQTIWARFGDPDEIANDFAMVHRFERRAISIAHSLALMAVSMLTVTGLISVFQLLVATCSSVPPAEAFPHLREEIIGFASLTLGYIGLHLEERLFQKQRLMKAFVLNCILFVCLFGLTSLWLHLTGPMCVLAFVSGVAVRVLQQIVIPSAWFLGTAVPMAVVYWLSGQHDVHFPLWASPLMRWTGITVACYFLTLRRTMSVASSVDSALNR
jgi:hypothetical protein